jgi:cyclopropane-fatty-acyl-phospholipid synthase
VNPWIERRIFPGAHPPTLGEMMQIFEPLSYSVLDVENLRLHYAKTLADWLERFERNAERIGEQFGERFVRTWRFYLIGSMAGFRSGGLQLFQILFSRGANNQIPWTRASFYPARGNRSRGNGSYSHRNDSGPIQTELANG